MKLSEAIRVGAKFRPQNFGELAHERGIGATCALGAAAEAVGVLGACMRLQSLAPLCDKMDLLSLADEPCPGERWCRWHAKGNFMPQLVAHLNDSHRWTREAIAEWVETLEKREEAKRETAFQALKEAVGEPCKAGV